MSHRIIQTLKHPLGGYLLLGIVIIGLILMLAATRGSFNWQIFLFGFIMSALPVATILIYSQLSKNRHNDNHVKYVADLKSRGERIKVQSVK